MVERLAKQSWQCSSQVVVEVVHRDLQATAENKKQKMKQRKQDREKKFQEDTW
jgi:hypothetical protein